MAARIAEAMRDEAYAASVELAQEKGAFPLFDAEQYLAAPRFASRLPDELKNEIRKHGMRNSHLLSIAPTGTISLAFADNASNGIEPPYSWTYQRKKRMPDGTHEDLRRRGPRLAALPAPAAATWTSCRPQFVTALEISALDHMRMVAAVAPFVDSAISKTVNVPEDYPYADFKDLYLEAWNAGLEGHHHLSPERACSEPCCRWRRTEARAAERPRHQRGPAHPPRSGAAARALQPALAGPAEARGRQSRRGPTWWNRRSASSRSSSATSRTATRIRSKSGSTAPSSRAGLGAVAKTLSMDMRAQDRRGCA